MGTPLAPFAHKLFDFNSVPGPPPHRPVLWTSKSLHVFPDPFPGGKYVRHSLVIYFWPFVAVLNRRPDKLHQMKGIFWTLFKVQTGGIYYGSLL